MQQSCYVVPTLLSKSWMFVRKCLIPLCTVKYIQQTVVDDNCSMSTKQINNQYFSWYQLINNQQLNTGHDQYFCHCDNIQCEVSVSDNIPSCFSSGWYHHRSWRLTTNNVKLSIIYQGWRGTTAVLMLRAEDEQWDVSRVQHVSTHAQ